MTKRERVIRAMQNQPVDRPPVGFWFHFSKEDSLGQRCVDAHLRYYNKVDVDIAKLMCDGYFDYPNPVAKAAKEPGDWYAMQPLGPDSEFIRGQVERAKAVKAGLKSDCMVLYNVFAPFSSIRFGTSDELVMRHLREEPRAIEYALDVIAQDNALLCEKLITEAGIDGVYYCVQGGEKDRFTPDEYRRYITPSDLKVLEHANRFSGCNVLHCCGWAGIPNNLEVWRDYPAAAVNWACFIENMGLSEGKEFFGGKCVLGGFDNRATGLMNTGTREEIQAFTRELVQRSVSTGVLLGADCTLPATVDVEHIQWVVDAVNAM
ncbi:MAG: uroporphyrinogen decarboxylase family protein [Candidatus Fimadaptatus sp.]